MKMKSWKSVRLFAVAGCLLVGSAALAAVPRSRVGDAQVVPTTRTLLEPATFPPPTLPRAALELPLAVLEGGHES